MKLKRLSFKELLWELHNVEFEDMSFIVGKNATGKSKALQIIDHIVKLLNQKDGLYTKAEYTICITNDNGEDITYTIHTNIINDEIGNIYEKIEIDGKTVLIRESIENTRIFNFLEGKEEVIYPPVNKLVIHTNRDIRKYPFFEEIMSWAKNSYGFKFGNISPDKAYNKQYKQDYELLNSVDNIPFLYKKLENEINKITIKDLKTIGFNVEEISSHNNNFSINLYILETGSNVTIAFHDLSQGLFRSISLLIFLEYLIAMKKPATIIIDDLCEGLDYERANKLGKLVFEKCLANNIQLIATSNDAFLMETVDLKYWNVLQRNGSVVTSLNAKNHPDLFRDFKFTGLSNFDFFASDYIAQKLEA